MKSHPIWSFGLFAAAAACFATGELRGQTARLPNVVFIFADDLGYGDIGAFGQKKIRTPNIDRLAKQGMMMMTHYAGNAVCAASRCSLLSGLNPGHAYIRSNLESANWAPGVNEGQEPVPPGELHFPLTMKKVGYVTGGFGKWSEGSVASTGNPLKQGFDHFYGYMCQAMAHNYYPKYLWNDGRQEFLDNPDFVGTLLPGREPVPNNYRYALAPGADPNDPASYRQFSGNQYSADLIAAKAGQFIKDNRDHPFFLYYATTIPHIDLQVPDDSLREYLGKFPDKPDPAGVGGGDAPPTYAPLACYAAMITRMDTQVGQIVREVHDLGLEDNTIFIFTSDNGAPPEPCCHFFNSGGPFRGYKLTMYEGGSREPCLVRWTGHIAAGSSSDRVTGGEDWLPTILELVGSAQSMPKGLDGFSFAPTLLGKAQPPRPFLYREMPVFGGEQFVREGKWKAIRQWPHAKTLPVEKGYLPYWGKSYPGVPGPKVETRPGVIELYDLEADPGEQRDVAADHPDIVARMASLLASSHVKSDLFPIAGLGERASKAGGRKAGARPVAAPDAAYDFKIKTGKALGQNPSAFAFSQILGPGFNRFDLPNTARVLTEVSVQSAEIASQAAQAGAHPSVGAVQASVWASILAQVFPNRQEALMAFGRRLAQEGAAGGSNFSGDVASGEKLGAEIARRLLADPAFQDQMDGVKDECLD